MREEAYRFGYAPLISVVVPVYDPEQRWLELALDSVLRQIYPRWELCVCNDGSTKEHVREVLSRYQRIDGRVKVKHMERNSGISAASNAALSMATGEFVALLDHDDELAPDALFEVVKLLQEHPDADFIYTDEDKINEHGARSQPHFKPGWSPDLLLCHNYITHLSVFRKGLLDDIGGFREGTEGSQDYDLILRFTEKTSKIHHIPKILYHWRMIEGSTALASEGKPYTHERSRKVLTDALKRRDIEGTVEDGPSPNLFRVKRSIKGEPLVSIIIPTRDNVSMLKRCVESIEKKTTYPRYEILIVDNDSTDKKTLEYLSSTPHRVLTFKEEFNHSRINNFAVSHARGEYVLLLNDDTEVISGEWVEAMLEHAQRPEVGAVGAKLLYPSGHIQHAGVVTGVGGGVNPGVAAHSYSHYPADYPGLAGALNTLRNYNAVTAACVMLRKSVYEEVGGFDEKNLPVTFNDVDLCMKIRDKGYLIVYTPYAVLRHYESASRGYDAGSITTAKAVLYMRERWGDELDDDPYYNPNFSRGIGDHNLRADLLRPRLLAARSMKLGSEETSSIASYIHPLLGNREEHRRHVEQHVEHYRRNIRSSTKTTLLPSDKAKKEPLSFSRTAGDETSKIANVIRPDQFIWMFGAPRTGSTWLSRIMGELANQQIWFEPLVGLLFGSFLYHRLRGNEQDPKRANMIMGEPHREVWLKSISNFVLDGARARYPNLRENQYLVVKEPNGSEGAPLIMAAMPESRLIFLIRDSRDAVASRLDANKKGNWGEQRGVNINWEYDTPEKLNKYTREAAAQYSELMSLVQEAYDQHPGPKALVRYEDLRNKPLATLKDMYRSLKVEIDETQLKAAIRKHSWERIPEKEKGAGKFYRKGQPGGWKEDLSREQIKIIEEETGWFLSRYGYELTVSSIERHI
ncbi:MAG: glycosyltransferase [Rubrobacter sp.]|nr:glycosyltransferase [Rubrobacter sp.]